MIITATIFALMFSVLFSTASADELLLDGTPLVSVQGEQLSFSEEMFNAKATVISFTYTGCSSICPVSDIVMGQLADLAESQEINLPLYTITLDPLNDTPEILDQHKEKYGFTTNPNWTWVTGEPSDVWNVLDRLGMQFGVLNEHSSYFVIVGERGKLSEGIREESATAESLLNDAMKMAAASVN